MDETMLPLADYAEQVAGRSLRSVQRWLEKAELPGAQQDEDGRWWVPTTARRTTSRAVMPAAQAAAAVPAPAVPMSPALGHGGSLEEFAAAVGFSRGGVRRLYRDMQAHPGLPFYVGRYGPTTALLVYAPPR